MGSKAEHHAELIRESAVKVSRIMELHESILRMANEDGAGECSIEMAEEIQPLYMELLSELRMVSTRFIFIAGALAGHTAADEALYQAGVIAQNDILNFLGNLPGVGIIFMDGSDDAESN